MAAKHDYFSTGSARQGLREKTVRGGAWAMMAQGGAVMLTLFSQPALARLLDPDDFGLIAMVAIFSNLGMMLVNAGLAMGAIQRDEITPQQISNLFWLTTAVGLVGAIIVVVMAPLAAILFGESRLVGITLALSALPILSSLTVVHLALLQRVYRFRELALIQFIAVLGGLALGVILAWRWHGQPNDYWALVAIPLATAFLTLLGVWCLCHWRPSLPKRGAGTRSLATFGAGLTAANLLNYLVRSTDRVLLGYFAGAQTVGYYDRAHRLSMYPLSSITPPLAKVAVPSLSRVASDEEAFTRAYLRVIRLTLGVLSPLLASVAVTADWWIVALLGSDWAPAGPAFRWFAVAGLLLCASSTTSWIFTAKGMSFPLFRWTLVDTLVAILSYLVGVPWGATGVAAVYALVLWLIRFPGLLWWTHRHEVIDVRRVLGEYVSCLPCLAVVILLNVILRLGFPELSCWSGALISLGVTAVATALVSTHTRQGKQLIAEANDMLQLFLKTDRRAIQDGIA